MNNIIYLAGPLFTEAEQRQRREEERALLEINTAFKIFNPITAVDANAPKDQEVTGRKLQQQLISIFTHDYNAIINAFILIADIANYDSGTLMEIGIALQASVPHILLVHSDFRLAGSDQPLGARQNKFVMGAVLANKNFKKPSNQLFFKSFKDALVEIIKIDKTFKHKKENALR